MPIVFYQCPFKLFFGASCPGCGMTRALFATLRLDFEQALYYHPLIFLVEILVAGWVLVRFKVITVSEKQKKVVAAVVVVLFFVTYAVRLFTTPEIVAIDVREGLIYKLISQIFI